MDRRALALIAASAALLAAMTAAASPAALPPPPAERSDNTPTAGGPALPPLPEGTLTPLQPLIDAVAPGGALTLPAGAFAGPVVITKPLTLSGAGAATVIVGDGDSSVIRVRAEGVTIRHLRAAGSGRDLVRIDAAIFAEKTADGLTVEDCDLDHYCFGIWIDGARAPRIASNRLIGAATGRTSERGNGIHLFDVRDGRVTRNTVWYGRDGIYISNSANSTIDANVLRRNRFGIHYMYSHENTVRGNVATDGWFGLALMYSRGLTIEDNRVRRQTGHGVLLRSIDNSVIARNAVSESDDALFLGGCNRSEFRLNLFTRCNIGVHVSGGSKDNVVEGNAFVRNRHQVRFSDTLPLVWSSPRSGNYWSDYVGPDLNADGVGDRPHFPAGVMEQLIFTFPELRTVMHSPAMQLLQGIESSFPVMRPAGVRDLAPLTSIADGVPALLEGAGP